MRNYRTTVAAVSLGLLAAAGAAWAADDAAAPAKPTGPTLGDVLTASGLTESGYIDGTFSYFNYSGTGSPSTYDTFTFQQAALQVAYQPTSGFGGLVSVIEGASPYAPNYSTYTPTSGSGTNFYLLQGFLQYVSGPLTVMGGKFTTLAGAEVVAPTGNTNVTRSLLFAYEPVTHTGVRAAYAISDTLTVTGGVNNGWFNSGNESSGTSDKTGEVGVTWAPSKMFTLAGAGYYGREVVSGTTGSLTLIDAVATVNATSALTVVVSADYGQFQPSGSGVSSLKWSGYAGYVNYAISDMWRVSVRGEYFDDKDGFNTGIAKNKLDEGTVTLGFAPVKNVELRLEGRYDKYDFSPLTTSGSLKTTQGWLEALYKF